MAGGAILIWSQAAHGVVGVNQRAVDPQLDAVVGTDREHDGLRCGHVNPRFGISDGMVAAHDSREIHFPDACGIGRARGALPGYSGCVGEFGCELDVEEFRPLFPGDAIGTRAQPAGVELFKQGLRIGAHRGIAGIRNQTRQGGFNHLELG